MLLSPSRINVFLFFKLPSAFWCGVRLRSVNRHHCVTTVKHNWFNKNPFNSLYFAVQAMAAELSTGVLVMQAIQESGQDISMLVAASSSIFSKKATGRIFFTCDEGQKVFSAVQDAIKSGQGQIIVLHSTGTNEKGEVVAEMKFNWTIKIKS